MGRTLFETLNLRHLLEAGVLECMFASDTCPCPGLNQLWAPRDVHSLPWSGRLVTINPAKGLFLAHRKCPHPHRVSHQDGKQGRFFITLRPNSSEWVEENCTFLLLIFIHCHPLLWVSFSVFFLPANNH